VRLAVRTDRMSLTPQTNMPNRVPAEVTAVEYHGPFVRVGLQDGSGGLMSLLLSEVDFFAHPVTLGQHVVAGFAPADAHLLAN
jgi:putative spermidine/putrescine transport system ATP-binding protein